LSDFSRGFEIWTPWVGRPDSQLFPIAIVLDEFSDLVFSQSWCRKLRTRWSSLGRNSLVLNTFFFAVHALHDNETLSHIERKIGGKVSEKVGIILWN
jgi:hypothetical protein